MTFTRAFSETAATVNAGAIEKGWWAAGRNATELIALTHAELSEALEGTIACNRTRPHLPGGKAF